MSLQDTPVANRIQIGFFGRCNSGKSTLVNSFTAQDVTIVSPVAGTTTDVVQKNIEIHGIGPCTLLDTAGFDDQSGDLGALRMEKTSHCAEKVEIAVVVFDQEDMRDEEKWIARFKEMHTPVVPVVSKCDIRTPSAEWLNKIEEMCGEVPLCVNIQRQEDLTALRHRLSDANPAKEEIDITGHLVKEGDVVLLVMPQDIQAPKGRLILPQVQTIRELLDKKCIVLSSTADQFISALATLKQPPSLIITDSQVFPLVHQNKPAESKLTSFSVLFAGLKGDLDYYIAGANIIEELPADAHILIAELCSHAPLTEDIGRVKLPRLLKKRLGDRITVEIVSGSDFPAELSNYDLIIQCGACMVNRKLVQNRIAKAKNSRIPMSNYGVVLAYLNNILHEISY